MENRLPLLEVKELKKHFIINRRLFKRKADVLTAVDGISFNICKGETFGLVGESGCGKSTLARTLIRLHEPTDGAILFEGRDISHIPKQELSFFKKKMQMIFQDPYASLNSRMTVREIINEPLRVHHIVSNCEKEGYIEKLLKSVGLDASHMNRYPHEFSGGQRQRIGIARALAVKPDFIICDEPISALDVSIQAQIVNMLEKLQEEMGIAYLFIAHDLSMVHYISDWIGVMYLGKLVELSTSVEVFNHPLHPYTKGLITAIPVPDPVKARKKTKIELKGEVISPINPQPGCRFSGRCTYADERCRKEDPVLCDIGGGHWIACHRYKQ
mgnify:CR=1 FL=1